MKRKVMLSCIIVAGIAVFLLLALLFHSVVTLVFTQYTSRYKSPLHAQNSKWTSEDGRITFVAEYPCGKGYIELPDEKIEFEISASLDGFLELHDPEQRRIPFEMWLWSYRGEDMFSATVSNTTYFTEGEVINFYRSELDMTDG